MASYGFGEYNVFLVESIEERDFTKHFTFKHIVTRTTLEEAEQYVAEVSKASGGYLRLVIMVGGYFMHNIFAELRVIEGAMANPAVPVETNIKELRRVIMEYGGQCLGEKQGV